LQIEITEYGEDFVDVDFTQQEMLVNLRFYIRHTMKLQEIIDALKVIWKKQMNAK